MSDDLFDPDSTDPRARLMQLLGRTFTELCDRPDGEEYATRFFDGRVSFVVSPLGIEVQDHTLKVVPDALPKPSNDLADLADIYDQWKWKGDDYPEEFSE